MDSSLLSLVVGFGPQTIDNCSVNLKIVNYLDGNLVSDKMM